MTQQNEAIRLAVEKLEYLEGWQAKDGASVVPEVAAEALTVLRPLLDQTSAGVGDGRHQWDRDGERCVKCGDKDWMNDPVCKGRALTQADQPADGAEFKEIKK